MDDFSLKFKIKMLTELEEDYYEIKEYIDKAKSEGKKSITINDDLHPIILDKLSSLEKVSFIKKRINIFGKKTIIYWD